MNDFTLTFLGALILGTLLESWLATRQLRHVAAHRDEVPQAFRERITLAAHRRAADYTLARTRLGLGEGLYDAVVLLALTLGGGLDLLDRLWRGTGLGPVATGTGFLVSLLLLTGLLALPFTLYRTFGVEQRFGFNRTPPALFVSDLGKQTLLLVLLGTPLAALVIRLMEGAGPLWWLWVWLVWIGFSLLMLWAYPALIAPLFNRFRPLDDAPLRQRIDDLLARCGFSSRGVFVMDGSRRSAHGNAYFTGFGRQKRIVFFDTLLDELQGEEVEAVLAHELGHFRRRHVLKGIAAMALVSLAGLAALGWLSARPAFYSALGVGRPSAHAALGLFLLIAPLFTLFLQPLFARIQRRHEYQADDFAAEQTDAGRLISALVKLYRENASTLTPDPLYSAFHDSHPPAPLRVAHLSAKMS